MAGAGLPSFDDIYIELLQRLEMLRRVHYVQRNVVVENTDCVMESYRQHLPAEGGLKAGRQQPHPISLFSGGAVGEEMRPGKDCAASKDNYYEENMDRKLIAGNGWNLAVKDAMCIRNIGTGGQNAHGSFDKKIKCVEGQIFDDAEKMFQCNTKIKSSILYENGEEARQSPDHASGVCPSFRKRKRKQENDKIYRVNGEKFEKKNVVESLKEKEALELLKYFTEELGNLLPNEIVVNGSASGAEDMELCKRLARQAGQLIREKNLLLEEEYSRIGQLERALREEQELKESLSSEVDLLKDRLHSVLSAAEQGSKSNCSYCSSILGEVRDRNNQEDASAISKSLKIEHIASSEAAEIFHPHVIHGNITPELGSEEGLTSNSGVLNNAFLLEVIRREINGQTQEEEGKVKKSKAVAKSAESLKTNERYRKGSSYIESKSSSLLSKFQGSEDVIEIQGNAKKTVQLAGKEHKRKNCSSLEIETDCSKGVTNEIEEEDDAVESRELQPKCSSIKMKAEEHDESIEDLEGMEVYNDEDLTNLLLELRTGNPFVEMKCGCTSQKYGDTVGTLRVYQTGVFEIYCDCMTGCDKGKPMTPAAFEKHGGRGSSRKWRYSIWILVGDQKVQLSRVKILEPYYLKYKSMKTTRGMELGNIRQAYHRDEFICCSKCHKERRFKRRNKEECRIYHDALANPDWECSDFPYDRCLTCQHDEEREVRRAVRGCTYNRVCAGCIDCVCVGCYMCCFSDCSCRTCVEFISNSNL